MFAEEKEIGTEAFVRNLANILEDAKRRLVETADELGIDVAEAAEAEITELRKEKRSVVKEKDLAKLAEQYAWDAGKLLEEDDDWLTGSELNEENINEVLAVLHWYRFFIAAKIERALGHLGDENFEQVPDPQSDANGSIKVALIAIERSVLAWTYLLDDSNAERVRPQIRLLERIKGITEDSFPRARDFVRPGFDEIDTVM